MHDGKRPEVKVLVVAGASGGHLYPALAFLDTCREKEAVKALFVLPRFATSQQQRIRAQITGDGYAVAYLSIVAVKRRVSVSSLIALARLAGGIAESIGILIWFRPHIVVGFGSLISVPMLLLARLCGARTLVHEQNVIPGRANRLLARCVDRVALSFAETARYLPYAQKKTVLTGNPLRKGLMRIDKKEALGFFGFTEECITILVMGGSQGSARVNAVFLEAVTGLGHKRKLQVIHLCGVADHGLLQKGYASLPVKAKVFSFLDRMHYAYSACDFAVSRSGATSIAEMIFFSCPAILIPYPHAYEHQLANARVLEQKGCGIIISEEGLTADTLRQSMDMLAGNAGKLASMRSAYAGFAREDAREQLRESVFALSAFKGNSLS